MLKSRHRQTGDPIDHGLRTWHVGDRQRCRHHTQDATDGSEADAGPDKELQGEMNQIDFVAQGRRERGLGLEPKLGLGLLGALLISISLALEALEFFSQVAIVIGTTLGFLFPALATTLDFRGRTHGTEVLGWHLGGSVLWAL